ncbi:MAG: hypothetical protein H7039_21630 [Bryobacteraceae bacterium]|nr:hypothetical protein [Bryobacteraceae bacterium]
MISRREFAHISLSAGAVAGSAGAVAGCRRQRGDGYNGYAFVANQDGKAVAAVDLTAFAVAKHIALGDSPTEILAHPSKPLIYALAPASGKIYEIDAAKLSVTKKLWLGGEATTMLTEPGGGCIWVLSGPGKRLLRVAFDPLRVTSAIRLTGSVTAFDVGAYYSNGDWIGQAAVADGRAGTVVLLNLKTGHSGKVAELGGELGSIRFRSDGRSVLVASRERQQLTVVDSPGGGIVVRLPLAVRPDHFCFHPNGGQLFITGEGRDAVVVVFPYYVPEVAETVLAASRPGAMAATYSHLFVTSPQAGDVSILDITRRRVMAVTAVGAGPGYVAVTPDSEYALVLNESSGDMAVIRVAGLRPGRSKTAALFTMIPVGSRPVSAAVTSV